MKDMICCKCGKITETCYNDSGALGMVHGDINCRQCYILDGHPECKNEECEALLVPHWNYCPICGLKQEVGE